MGGSTRDRDKKEVLFACLSSAEHVEIRRDLQKKMDALCETSPVARRLPYGVLKGADKMAKTYRRYADSNEETLAYFKVLLDYALLVNKYSQHAYKHTVAEELATPMA